MLRAQFFLLLGGGQNAHTQWLAQIEFAACGCGVVLLQFVFLYQTGHRQTKNRFRRINTVTTGQHNAGIRAGLTATVDHALRDFRRQHIYRPAKNRNRH